jgi:hypothetical protein
MADAVTEKILAEVEPKLRAGAHSFLLGLSQSEPSYPFGFAFSPDSDKENWIAGYADLFAGSDLIVSAGARPG